jgi:hypothetical protein
VHRKPSPGELRQDATDDPNRALGVQRCGATLEAKP